MRIITSPTEFEKTLINLFDEYKTLDFAVAWAGVGTEIFDQLIRGKAKIRKGVVGIHFYQTHPEFISEFINSDCQPFQGDNILYLLHKQEHARQSHIQNLG